MSYRLLSDLGVEGNKNDFVGVAPYLVVSHSILHSHLRVESEVTLLYYMLSCGKPGTATSLVVDCRWFCCANGSR